MVSASPCLWQPPPISFLKFNLDVVTYASRNCGATVVVVRDYQGNCLDWCCPLSNPITDPLLLKSMTCREILMLTKNEGLSHFLVESDSSSIINACKGGPAPLSIQNQMIDIHELTIFRSCLFPFLGEKLMMLPIL